MHSRAANEEALICLRAPERAVAFRSIYGLLWPRWCQLGCHSFPSPNSGHVYISREITELQWMQESQSPKLGPYTVLSHPLKIANRLCILILWNTICAFQSSQWRSTDMLARSGARSSILWHLWPAMAVLVSIGLSFLSISILGMSKYPESREVTELQWIQKS